MSSIHNNSNVYGTLIAAVFYNGKYFLFSDGRLTDSQSKSIISDSHSKLHKLTNYSAMLAAGRFLPNLTPNIVKSCLDNELICVEDVITIAKPIIEAQWNSLLLSTNTANKDIKFFCFIVGIDKRHLPRLFYLDNQTNPPLLLQERPITDEIEIAAISYGSDSVIENPSNDFTFYLRQLSKQTNILLNPQKVFYDSFVKTQEKLSKSKPLIGGKTFFSTIDSVNGYKTIY